MWLVRSVSREEYHDDGSNDSGDAGDLLVGSSVDRGDGSDPRSS